MYSKRFTSDVQSIHYPLSDLDIILMAIKKNYLSLTANCSQNKTFQWRKLTAQCYGHKCSYLVGT